MSKFKMIAKTLFGFEPLLAEELRKLGAGDIQSGNRMVSFTGDLGFLYKANLSLRTALKILKPIQSKRVFSEDQLYRFVQSIDWNLYLDESETFAVQSTVYSTVFTHSHYVALKVKDAIVDQFHKQTGSRPDVNTDHPDVQIQVHIHKDLCTISLDSSGESLHQRGYRSITNQAPINEVLAAGLLLHSGWNGQSAFLDPMCGSGTLAIEAAMIACQIPPLINRKEFAFEKWLDWDLELFETIEAAMLKKVQDTRFPIFAWDIQAASVKKAERNAQNANLSEFITFETEDFFASTKPVDGHLHMIFNPPYGERMPIPEDDFYKHMGDTLKQNYPDTSAWFITSQIEAHKFVGLRPSRKIKVFNAKLESRLFNFQIYSGSKKAKYQSEK